MRTYIVIGDMESLEETIKGHEIELGYRSKYLPLAEIKTRLPEEDIHEILNKYKITTEKTYEVPE